MRVWASADGEPDCDGETYEHSPTKEHEQGIYVDFQGQVYRKNLVAIELLIVLYEIWLLG